MDLFEDIKTKLGCNYISDICSGNYIEIAKKVVANADLKQYSAHDLADMAEYLYGYDKSFADKEEAIRFLCEKESY